MIWKILVWVLEALIVLAALVMCMDIKAAPYSTAGLLDQRQVVQLRPEWMRAPYGLDETRLGELVVRPGELVLR